MAELTKAQVTNRLNDTFNAISESSASREFSPIANMYVDLTLLKDTRMGLMISLSDATRKQYLLEGLAKYNNRLSRSFKEVYPEFPYKEEELEQMWKDPNRSDEIFRFSPDTEMSLTLNKVLEYILSHNSFVRYKGDVKLTINTYPLIMSEHVRVFEKTLQQLLAPTAVKVTFVSMDPRGIVGNFWEHQDWLYIDDLSLLSQDRIPFTEVFYRGKMPTATVVFPPCLTREMRTKWIREGVDFSSTDLIKYKLTMATTLLAPVAANVELCHVRIPIPKSVAK